MLLNIEWWEGTVQRTQKENGDEANNDHVFENKNQQVEHGNNWQTFFIITSTYTFTSTSATAIWTYVDDVAIIYW